MAKATTMHAAKPKRKASSRPAKPAGPALTKLVKDIATPGTEAYARMEKSRRAWQKRIKPIKDAVERSQRMTAADMLLIVNT